MEKMTSDQLTTLLKASPEVYDDVIKKDQEKLESLREEFAGYLEKQKQGLYGQEYEAKKDIQGNCYLYGVDVDHAKRADMDGLYEMDSRYNDFGPILFRELGYTFEIPEEDIKNMTPAEYANFMGSIWEIFRKYETRADDLEDIRTVITILSAFSIYGGAEGVASAVAIDTGLDTADTAVSIISGDQAGTILGILSIALPALMDDAAKGGKLAAKDLSNGIEGLSEVDRVKLYKALEVEGITDIRRLDVDQEVLTIYSKEATYEIRMMDGVVEGTTKINFKSILSQSADEVNDSLKALGYTEAPYKPGTVVNTIELTEETKFVRVYDGVNSQQAGGWVMKAEDIAGLTPQQIQNKFALPSTPTQVTDVIFESGTTLRTGVANDLFGFDGGGTQFDLMGQYIGDFINPRPLP